MKYIIRWVASKSSGIIVLMVSKSHDSGNNDEKFSSGISFIKWSFFYNFRIHRNKALYCGLFGEPFFCASISSAVGCPSFATLVHVRLCNAFVQSKVSQHPVARFGHLHSCIRLT